MTKSRGVGRGGKRAGAGVKRVLDFDGVACSTYLSEDDVRWLLENFDNVSAGIRECIRMSRAPRTPGVLKSTSNVAGAKAPFVALPVPTQWPDGRAIPLHYMTRVRAETDAKNAQRRKLYDAGQPYKHLT